MFEEKKEKARLLVKEGKHHFIKLLKHLKLSIVKRINCLEKKIPQLLQKSLKSRILIIYE
jgi:hypothetical protein